MNGCKLKRIEYIKCKKKQNTINLLDEMRSVHPWPFGEQKVPNDFGPRCLGGRRRPRPDHLSQRDCKENHAIAQECIITKQIPSIENKKQIGIRNTTDLTHETTEIR